jgi:hypothetical protein
MKQFITSTILCGIILTTTISCNLQPITVTVTGLGWVIKNFPSSYWLGSPPPSSCFYDFWIYYTGTFALSDIEYARVYNNNKTRWWDIPLVEDYFTSEYIGGWFSFYDNDYFNTLPIGNLTAEIKLKNGSISSFDKVIPAPGSTTTLGYEKVYTEDCSVPPYNSINMIYRPVVTGSTISYGGSELTINFAIDDSRVYNGWVWLYDSSNNTVAYSTLHFRDSTNGNLTSIISSPFQNDGTPNTVSITNTDLTFITGRSFNEIAKLIVVVTDGNQFALEGKYNYYDCLAASEKTAF